MQVGFSRDGESSVVLIVISKFDLFLQYLEANEVLDLKCTTLKKDAKMYRDRLEGILKQMDEVIRERDKVNML